MHTTDCPDEDTLIREAMEPGPGSIDRHIAECQVCRQRFDETRGLLAGLQVLSNLPRGKIPKSASDDQPTAIAQYFILGTIQERESAIAFRAMNSLIPADEVCIFISRTHSTSDGKQSDRLRAAFSPLKRLKHPGICPLVDIGFSQGRSYVIFEYPARIGLKQWLVDYRPTLSEIATIGLEVADAIISAHENDLHHGALCLDSISLDEAGHVRIVDFGITRLAETPQSFASEQDAAALIGILAMLSPELGQQIARGTPINAGSNSVCAIRKICQANAKRGFWYKLFRS